MSDALRTASLHERIYAVVQQIPAGKVSTYGQVSEIVGRGCTARVVGYAMSALKVNEAKTPWQRVINSKGEISQREEPGPTIQRALLEKEGITFDDKDRIDFNEYGWQGPPWPWLEENQFNPPPLLGKPKKAQGHQPSLF